MRFEKKASEREQIHMQRNTEKHWKIEKERNRKRGNCKRQKLKLKWEKLIELTGKERKEKETERQTEREGKLSE